MNAKNTLKAGLSEMLADSPTDDEVSCMETTLQFTYLPVTEIKCRVCHYSLLPSFEVASYSLSRCSACSFLQVNERPNNDNLQQLYSGDYFSMTKYGAGFVQRRENLRRLNLLRKYVPANEGTLLEVGCGTCEFLSVAQKEYDVWGCDFSKYAIEKAEDKFPSLKGRIWAESLEDDSGTSETFGAVVAWDVIEHLWDVRKVAERLLRMVRPGGYLILSTPDTRSLTAKLFRKHWAFLTVPEHLSLFSIQSMTQLFSKECGAEIVYSSSFGKWVSLGFLFYKIGRILPINFRGLIRILSTIGLEHFPLYVPTSDVLYVVIRRTENREE